MPSSYAQTTTSSGWRVRVSTSCSVQDADRRERPEIAVEVAAARDRIDVRAEEDRRERRARCRRASRRCCRPDRCAEAPARRIRSITYLPAGDVGVRVADAADAVRKGPAGRTSEDAERFDLRPHDAAIDSRRRRARGCSRAYAVRKRADEAPTIYHPRQFTLSVEGSYGSATRDPHDSVQPRHLRALGANIEPVRRPLTRSDKPSP